MNCTKLNSPKVFVGEHLRACSQRTVAERRPSTIRMAMIAPAAPLEVVKVDGTVVGSESLSLKVAEPEKANGLVHRYLVKVRRDFRQGSANTKTRAEVRGGGRKPYQQKGTGRARRGSTRSPLIVGGGVVFGPKPRDYSIDMNRKERRLALATAIQSAVDDIIVADKLEGEFTGKTKNVIETLASLGVDPEEHCLVITKDKDELLARASKNAPRIEINSTAQINVYDVLRADKIVIEQGALKHIQEFYGESQE